MLQGPGDRGAQRWGRQSPGLLDWPPGAERIRRQMGTPHPTPVELSGGQDKREAR